MSLLFEVQDDWVCVSSSQGDSEKAVGSIHVIDGKALFYSIEEAFCTPDLTAQHVLELAQYMLVMQEQ